MVSGCDLNDIGDTYDMTCPACSKHYCSTYSPCPVLEENTEGEETECNCCDRCRLECSLSI